MGATCAGCTCTNAEQQTEYQIGIVSHSFPATHHHELTARSFLCVQQRKALDDETMVSLTAMSAPLEHNADYVCPRGTGTVLKKYPRHLETPSLGQRFPSAQKPAPTDFADAYPAAKAVHAAKHNGDQECGARRNSRQETGGGPVLRR